VETERKNLFAVCAILGIGIIGLKMMVESLIPGYALLKASSTGLIFLAVAGCFLLDVMTNHLLTSRLKKGIFIITILGAIYLWLKFMVIWSGFATLEVGIVIVWAISFTGIMALSFESLSASLEKKKGRRPPKTK
jgi:hypothetical protein